MADLEETQEQAGEEAPVGDVEAASAETPRPAALSEQERRTWEGRLRTEQSRLGNIATNLAQYGLEADQYGNVQQMAGYEAPVSEAEDIIDYEDPAQTRARISALADQRATQIVGGALKAIAPLLGDLYEDRLMRKYTDWGDIGADTEQLLRQSGFQNAIQAAAMRPDILNMAVLAARGKRAGATGGQRTQRAAEAPGAEEERKRRIEEAADVGGSVLTQMKRVGLHFTPEEEQYRREQGLSEEELAESLAGPVVIDVLGKKKGRKA